MSTIYKSKATKHLQLILGESEKREHRDSDHTMRVGDSRRVKYRRRGGKGKA